MRRIYGILSVMTTRSGPGEAKLGRLVGVVVGKAMRRATTPSAARWSKKRPGLPMPAIADTLRAASRGRRIPSTEASRLPDHHGERSAPVAHREALLRGNRIVVPPFTTTASTSRRRRHGLAQRPGGQGKPVAEPRSQSTTAI